MLDVKKVIRKWLEENEDEIFDNISNTIEEWLDKNKQEIYDIIANVDLTNGKG
jgi:hypothetical protein